MRLPRSSIEPDPVFQGRNAGTWSHLEGGSGEGFASYRVKIAGAESGTPGPGVQ